MNDKPKKSPGRKPSFTPDQVRRIQESKAEGMSNQFIADAMGVSAGTISSYIRGERGNGYAPGKKTQ